MWWISESRTMNSICPWKDKVHVLCILYSKPINQVKTVKNTNDISILFFWSNQMWTPCYVVINDTTLFEHIKCTIYSGLKYAF